MKDTITFPERRITSLHHPHRDNAEPSRGRIETISKASSRRLRVIHGLSGSSSDEGQLLLALAFEIEPQTSMGSVKSHGHQHGRSSLSPIMALGLVRAQLVSVEGKELFRVAECRAGGNADSDERTVVNGLWFALNSWKPKLVTFGGQSHGLPALRLASMRHGLTAPEWAGQLDLDGTAACGRNPAYHIDLKATLLGDHADGQDGLDEIVKSVWGASWHTSEIGARDMAEFHAALIFILYLRWRLFGGETSKQFHNDSLESLRSALRARAGNNQALAKLIKSWSVFQA